MASLCSLRGEVGSGICVYWIAAASVAQPWVYGGARWARQLFGCCCVVWQRGAQEGANMRELRGERGGTEGAIRGTEKGEREKTEGRKRMNKGDGRERMGGVTGGLGRGRWTWGNGQRL